jgi:hypothetical protein
MKHEAAIRLGYSGMQGVLIVRCSTKPEVLRAGRGTRTVHSYVDWRDCKATPSTTPATGLGNLFVKKYRTQTECTQNQIKSLCKTKKMSNSLSMQMDILNG